MPSEQTQHYLALYRKYRPLTFDDVCGRDAIVRTLKNQIISGRIGHSYLFCGTRGTGKTSIAKIFARAVNCEDLKDGNPCGKCSSCLAIMENANLNVVEMDAASNNGVDDIRSIIDQVSYSPTQGRYRVYIIDEVHMLSTAAFNALLKTLEEPPSYAIFILATTEPARLPLTILSRCQRYDFGRLPSPVIGKRLKDICEMEGIDAEEKALGYIASSADGSLRDGISLLDQCNAFNFGQGTLTYDKALEILGAVDTEVFCRLFTALHEARTADAVGILDEILSQGRELVQFVSDYTSFLRNILLLKASPATEKYLDAAADQLRAMKELAQRAELPEIMNEITVFSELAEQIRYAQSRRILVEIALIRLCRPSVDAQAPGYAPEAADGAYSVNTQERLRVLEEKLLSDEELFNSRMVSFQGVSEQPVSSAAPGQERAHPDNKRDETDSTAENRPAPVLAAAVPDDIRSLVAGWNKILAGMPAGYLKPLLRKAKLSLGDRQQLLIVFENAFYADSFNSNETIRREFENYLASATGRDIPVEYKCLDNGGKFRDNYVDLQDIVKMDIEVEDDD
ncbi:MAG: DNA polymerase III subunit gamma/tau [Lachnospiraceae bacterium]|nr:DNA polymerase III subunit gamma/tau [Lachnospiraceae bacterium]